MKNIRRDIKINHIYHIKENIYSHKTISQYNVLFYIAVYINDNTSIVYIIISIITT